METLSGVVMKKRSEEKGVGPFGFNKNADDENKEDNDAKLIL